MGQCGLTQIICKPFSLMHHIRMLGDDTSNQSLASQDRKAGTQKNRDCSTSNNQSNPHGSHKYRGRQQNPGILPALPLDDVRMVHMDIADGRDCSTERKAKGHHGDISIRRHQRGYMFSLFNFIIRHRVTL